MLASVCALSAQTTPALPPVRLEEFTVSGNKLESYQADRVQVGAFRDVDPVDVPLTVNVLTREALDAQSARSVFDALKNTAGATRSQLSGSVYDNIAVRGILVENRGNYRLNGSLPIINLIDLSLENKERVEVLKGGSSLYYGFVPPSGVINLTTKRPLPQPLTSLTVNANNYGAVSGHLDLSRRFGPAGAEKSMGLRLNFAGGNEELGIDNYSGTRFFAAAAYDWKVNDKLLVRFDFENLKKDVTEQTTIALLPAVGAVGGVGGTITLPPMPRLSRNFGGDWLKYDANMANVLARADYLISPQWTVFIEAGRAKTYRNRLFSQLQNYNLTTGAANLSINFTPSQLYQNTNWRGEAFGRFLTAGVQHNLTLGATTNARQQDIYNLGNGTFATNFYNPLPVPQLNPPTATTTRTPNKIVDTGFYVYDRLVAFDDHLQIIGGLRSTDYSSHTTVYTTNNTTRVTTVAPTNYDVSNKVSPMLTAAWKPTRKSSLYVSYLKALEAGANAPNTTVNAGSVLPPLESRQYEVGVKAELFGGLLVQVGYFDIERPSTFTTAANLFTANGKATYQGTELFASGEIVPSLSLIASGVILDSEQTNAANAATFGRIPQGTAKYTGSLFLDWHVPGLPELTFNGGAFYTGRRPMNDANQAFIGGFTTFNAGAAYRFAAGGRSYRARVTIENIFERAYWSASNGFLATNFPRQIKFSLTTNF